RSGHRRGSDHHRALRALSQLHRRLYLQGWGGHRIHDVRKRKRSPLLTPMNLTDKVILVTGGTSGIGEACARHFASLGAKVVAASNQQDRGEALETELRAAGQEVRFVYVDVSDEAQVKAMVDFALSTYGRLDGVHCNAGVWGKGTVAEFAEAIWNK